MRVKERRPVKLNKRKRRLDAQQFELYLLMLIPVLSVFVFSYLPMGGIIIAFKNFKFNKGIFGSDWVGFENFEVFFKSDVIGRITRNTIVLNLAFIFLGVIFGMIVAILLFEARSRAAVKTYQTILITPTFVSWVIAAYMVYAILNPNYGVLNNIIELFGGKPIDWYSEPEYWPVILAICNLWKSVGMGSIWYYAALMGVDSQVVEAAEVDGANRWQVYRHVMVPLIVPIIVIRFILSLGNIFHADFGLFYQVTRDMAALYETTDVVDTYIYRAMRTLGDMGMSAAVGLLQSVIGFTLVMITNKVTKKIDSNNALF